MPFVEGESLRDDCRAKAAACRHGAPHRDRDRRRCNTPTATASCRDIKPENILVHGGHALVADFGISLAASNTAGTRLTETGMSLGTPTYMSPEQAIGDRAIDGRSDVYSVAAVLYEMLAGDAPYVAGTAQAIIAKVLTEKAPSVRLARPSVPAHVDGAITRARSRSFPRIACKRARVLEALAGAVPRARR